jgi:hypothetical protein
MEAFLRFYLVKPSLARSAGTLMVSEYNGMTVPELKEMLRTEGLPVNGTKPVLIRRLEEHQAIPEHSQTVSLESEEDRVEFDCLKCKGRLRIVLDHRIGSDS